MADQHLMTDREWDELTRFATNASRHHGARLVDDMLRERDRIADEVKRARDAEAFAAMQRRAMLEEQARRDAEQARRAADEARRTADLTAETRRRIEEFRRAERMRPFALDEMHPPNTVDYDPSDAMYTVRNDRAVHDVPQSPAHRELFDQWRERVFGMPPGQARIDAMRRHPLPVRHFLASFRAVWGRVGDPPPSAPTTSTPAPRVPAVVSFTGRRPIAVGDDEEV